MKRSLRIFLSRVLCLLILLISGRSAYASHIIGMDLNYSYISDSTYKISLVVYGDCAGTAFSSLATSTPTICVYDGATSVTSLTLAVQAPSAGVEITPVCVADSNQTTCTSLTNPVAGIKKFVYSATYTLPNRSHYWRFIFAGGMASGYVAGRSAQITNITSPGTSITELVDTLDNTNYHNSNPVLTVLPTPYYCLNHAANYNPGAVDVDGDQLSFSLVAGLNNGPNGQCATSGTINPVTYIGGHSGSFPLQTPAGSFSFSASTGQISFTPDTIQKSLVVYNIREFRNDTLIGTSQREMVYTVVTCSTPPPNGSFTNVTSGTIDDSSHMHICAETGAFAVSVAPTAEDTSNVIYVTSSGLPAGATFTVVNDSTNHPVGTLNWTTTGTAPGVYSFYLTFTDNACPLAGSVTKAFTITVNPQPDADTIHGLSSVCSSSSITLTDTASGGTWSHSFSGISGVTSGGVVTGVSAGIDTIKYTVVNSCNTAIARKVITVNPLPNAGTITGLSQVCQGTNITLADAISGGYWTSSATGIGTVTSIGVVHGVAAGIDTIKYIDTNMCGTAIASKVVTVLAQPNAGIIAGPSVVCIGNTITLTDTVAGGTWSAQNGNATIGSTTGILLGSVAGTDSVHYTYGNTCGTAVVARQVTILPAPDAGVINGLSSVCTGAAITLSDTSMGGAGLWSSTNLAMATVTSGGVVTGVSAAGGIDTIKYTVSSTCGSVAAMKAVTILPLASAGVINGASIACLGSSITLTDTSGGGAGAWTRTNATANVAGGIVTPVSLGIDTIKYTVTNTCGSATATRAVTITQVPSAGFITGLSSVCVAASITLTDTTSGGTWASSARATVAGGIVTGISAGPDTVSYSVGNTCGSSTATKILTINPLPVAGTIAGASSVCMGATLTLTDTATGGVWSASNSNAGVSGGIVTPAAPGTDTIAYTVTNVCGVIAATKVVTIDAQPNAGAIAGGTSVCAGSTLALADAAGGGVWSATNAKATVVSGTVTGVSAGIDTIKYTVTNVCGVAVAQKIVTVNPLPVAGTIAGASTVCAGSAITLTDTASGGAWSSSNNLFATVAGGVVTGVSAGVDTIKYTVTNGCGTAIATRVITVNALPVAGGITGTPVVCVGAMTTLADGATGGVWSSSNTHATVSGGIVTGVSAGTDTISYTVTNSCAVASTAMVVTVNPLPNAGAITGASAVCVASAITLTDTAGGGTWSVNNGNAAVTSGGVVTGVAAGPATISYTVNVACGTLVTTHDVTINPLPDAGTISGAGFICITGSATMTDAAAGGTWSATNSNAVILSTGLTGGISAGLDTLLYTVTNGCGTAVAAHVVNVGSAVPTSPVTGLPVVCAGSNITLTDTTGGGVWSSSNTTVASVNTAGVVHGVAAGTVTISYIYTSTCGSFVATAPVTVSPLPDAGVITGNNTICTGSILTLTDTTSGGTWTSGNSAAATVSGGLVTPIAWGASYISYTVVNSCGSATARLLVSVSSNSNAGTISGPSTVCPGASVTLATTGGNGYWLSSDSAKASVNSTGIVTGHTSGTLTISYIANTGCVADTTTFGFTVLPLPAAGVITGGGNICTGNTLTLADTAPGGVWSSSNSGIAAVDPAGVVTGTGTGTAVIAYTSTTGCGTQVATDTINVIALPYAGTISGTTTVCQGATSTLTETASGGNWTSSNTVVATVNAAGVVTGVSAGTATISYTDSTTCGSAVSTAAVTINPLPVAGTITGSPTVCNSSTAPLSDTTANGLGTWTSSNPAAITIDLAGVVTGVASGTSTISYTVNNSCGTATATFSVTSGPAPNSGAISGTTTFCQNAFSPLTETVSGGTWSSGNTAVATVNSSGVVYGVSGGTAVISYTITGGCTGATATTTVTINPFPNAGTINGSTTVCIGSATTLTDTAAGGTWTSGNTSIATVNAGGVVTGLAPGVVNIYYARTNGCGATNATVSLTVSAAPSAGTISGNMAICPGNTSALTENVGGGAWSSSNPAVAIIDTNGVVTAIATGAATITYSVASACGSSAAIAAFTVTGTNVGIISGTTTLCPGNTSTLTETVAGGTWSSSNTAVAAVSASGVVTAVSGGTANIFYLVNGTCGLANASALVTVNAVPSAGAITGGTAICLTSTSALADTVSGGTWTSSNPLVAPVSPAGVVTGLAVGTATISYSVNTTCGTAVATAPVAVNTTPDEGVMIGATVICAGSTSPFTESAPGGVWSSNDTAIATVNGSGLVTGVSGGTTIISYTVNNGCGVAIATADMIIKPLPNAGTITGTSALCVGVPATFTDTAAGGSWTSSNSGIAAVTSAGQVTGLTAGNAVITYSVTNSCGTANATFPLVINTLPASAGSISGTGTMCPGIPDVLTDTTSGGVWSSTNTAVATVSATGIMTGVAAGNATISYTVTNACGAVAATFPVTISTGSSAGTITAPSSSVCMGGTIALADTTTGGTWSSSNTAVAAVNAAGLVTSAGAGTATITYTVSNGCGTQNATYGITINPLPVAGQIAGGTTVCVGTSVSLTNTAAGGAWSSSNTAAATINAATGVVTGIAPGNTTITYVVTSGAGCTTTVTMADTVDPQPVAGGITAATTTVCALSAITLSDATPGGVWSSSDTALATVNASGTVTGVSFGFPSISYSVTNNCGTAVASVPVNVNPAPFITPITGATTICLGYSITLEEGSFTGTWTSSDTTVATVNGSGVVTSAGVGTTIISYSLTNVFGCTAATAYTDTVNPSTNAGSISAATTTVCPGATTAFTDATGGGIWSSGNAAVATVDASGLVTGVSSGVATISYTVSNSFGCNSSVTADVAVNPQPAISPVTGTVTLCTTGTTLLSDAVFGGVWTSSNTSVATINAGTGQLSGVSAGVVTISYTVSNVFGCTNTATAQDTIVAPPVVAAITGSTHVCAGSTTTLTDVTPGGIWSSSNTSAATVDAAGVVTGLTAGTTDISYTASSLAGCSTAVAATVTVEPLPVVAAISGPSAVCVGNTITASDITGSGAWTSSDNTIATIDGATGVVNAISAGMFTISYQVISGAGCSTTVTTSDTVNALPVVAAITGTDHICVNGTATLANTTTGGVWSSSNAGVSAVDASGVVTAIAAGTDSILYTVTNAAGCMNAVMMADTVEALPVVAAIAGSNTVCQNASITLTNATPGGVWSGSNAIATVDPALGVVTGLTAGNLAVSYTLTSVWGCVTTVTYTDTVHAAPVATPVTGASSMCLGSTTTLGNVTTGGTWVSSNPYVSIVNAATGVVTTLAPGVDTIYYTVSMGAGCPATAMFTDTVVGFPVVAAITGTAELCAGNQTLLTDSTAGGTWSSSDNTVAGVSTTGALTGVAAGSATISYSVTNITGCATVTTVAVTVDPLPVPGAISGSAAVCVGNVTSLSSSTVGVWSSSDAAIATIDATSGVLTGVAAGSATISLTVTSAAGCVAAITTTESVQTAPVVDAITGTTSTCAGSTVTLSDATMGGTWSSSNTAVAVVDAGGAVTMTGSGTATITYSVGSVAGCVTDVYTSVSTISLPASTILPAVTSATLCHGNPVVLAVSSTGSTAGLTYQWYRNGVAIAGAVTAGYTATTPGAYNVVISAGACTDTLTGVNVIAPPAPVIAHGTGTLIYTGSFTTYQWLLNGHVLTGATSSVYNAITSGTYTVIVSDGNGCTDTSAALVVTNGSSAVQVVTSAADIKLYPNPATALIAIDAPVKVNVIIYSMDGKLLIRQDDATRVDISQLANAMYLIMVYDEQGVLLKTDRFMKAE